MYASNGTIILNIRSFNMRICVSDINQGLEKCLFSNLYFVYSDMVQSKYPSLAPGCSKNRQRPNLSRGLNLNQISLVTLKIVFIASLFKPALN